MIFYWLNGSREVEYVQIPRFDSPLVYLDFASFLSFLFHKFLNDSGPTYAPTQKLFAAITVMAYISGSEPSQSMKQLVLSIDS
jgi:hypothetical protein